MDHLSRILYVDHTARLGGGEIALFNLIEAIDRSRFKPVVLLFETGPLLDRLASAGVEVHVLTLGGDVANARKDALGGASLLRIRSIARAAAFVWKLREKVRGLRPDVVHTNSLKADVLAGLAARLVGVPVIWHVRDRIADDYLPPAVARVFRWLAQRIPTIVIANSHATLATLTKQTRGVAIPSGVVDVPTWQVIHDGVTEDAPVSNAHELHRRALVVGLVGRLARWKGQHVFIEAARCLHADHPNTVFRIVGAALFGESDYENELRQSAEACGLSNVVEFTGFRQDVTAAIGELDVLVHASITGEPFGQVIVEGMAAGKPVVATRGGGVPEIIEDGVTGLLVPMGDATAMAVAVARLLSDGELRRSMGDRGRQRVIDRFTIRHTAVRVQEVYTQLLARRARRAS